MPTKTCILCPGQGAQVVGMGKDFYVASPVARQVFETANKVLGFDLAALCFTGPEERLNQTDISQPAIYTTSIASYRAGVDAGLIDPSNITGFAGLSLGEYTALHLGGAFEFEEGLKLVAARGRYMQEAAVASPSGMIALIGADEDTARKLCHDVTSNNGGSVLVPANFNAPGQIVVSGSREACEKALIVAEEMGLRATALKVAGAFHSPLMQPAADRMLAELEKVSIRTPSQQVYSNVTAQPHGTAQSIRSLLVDQIVSPVKWEQTMTPLMGGTEPARFVELAPGRTLAGLAKRINRKVPIESLATIEALGSQKGA